MLLNIFINTRATAKIFPPSTLEIDYCTMAFIEEHCPKIMKPLYQKNKEFNIIFV